ncbi:MAG: hypothetical protein ISS36_01730 [Candidatus Aenigmarchaeota archaeon]|nr:hypothetical protein [Candidatus Aenigmarchaeota archaeon]
MIYEVTVDSDARDISPLTKEIGDSELDDPDFLAKMLRDYLKTVIERGRMLEPLENEEGYNVTFHIERIGELD